MNSWQRFTSAAMVGWAVALLQKIEALLARAGERS
jgi:hypothetical protein